jgi:hypothetical protein
MHHLILLRQNDQQMSGSSCCGRIEANDGFFSGGQSFVPGAREEMTRVGEIYRAVRAAFGDAVEVSILDPRNQLTVLPLLVRDAFRYRVPALTALRTIMSTSMLMGVFDGQVLYAGEIPTPSAVVDLIAGRMSIDRVGAV